MDDEEGTGTLYSAEHRQIKYHFQKGEKDALDERMNNKPLSPRRKSPEKKNVASLQVEIIYLTCFKVGSSWLPGIITYCIVGNVLSGREVMRRYDVFHCFGFSGHSSSSKADFPDIHRDKVAPQKTPYSRTRS